jgi:hypothetical protein
MTNMTSNDFINAQSKKELRPATKEEATYFAITAKEIGTASATAMYRSRGIEINTPSSIQAIGKKLFAETKKLERQAFEDMKAAGANFEKMTKDQVVNCITLILNGLTPKEALINVASLSGKDSSWVDSIKTKVHRNQVHHGLEQNESHQVVKSMKAHKILTRSDKAQLCKGSLSSSLTGIYNRKAIIDKFNAYEKRMAELEARMLVVEDKTAEQYTKVEAMAIAKRMKANGNTQQEVSLKVGKSRRTIERWWAAL